MIAVEEKLPIPGPAAETQEVGQQDWSVRYWISSLLLFWELSPYLAHQIRETNLEPHVCSDNLRTT
jgi:hypothetical protein